jgi:hypothetical protein
LGRTGTHSLQAALVRLGYAPCEYGPNLVAFPERCALWLEAARRKQAGEPIDWRPLFVGYRATLEWPGVFFWRELIAAHPEAKVILTQRDPEAWYDSAYATLHTKVKRRTATLHGRLLANLLAWLEPRTGHRFRLHEIIWDETFRGRFSDRAFAKDVFEQHHRDVAAEVPAERLLVFDVRQGWEPLCAFLGVPVPVDEPFPHVNDTETFSRWQRRHTVELARAILPALGAAALGAGLGLIAGLLPRRAPWMRRARRHDEQR